MKRRKVDASMERRFIAALITDKRFLIRAAPRLDVELIPTPCMKRVAKWALDAYKSHGKPIGRGIEVKVQNWMETEHPSDADAEMVREFLTGLSAMSDTQPAVNPSLMVDELDKWQGLARLKRACDQALSHHENGDLEKGTAVMVEFHAHPTINDAGYAPSRQMWQEAFSDEEDSLMEFPPDAARFFGGSFCRDSLIAIQGADKKGKTQWCMEFMYRGLRSRQPVAFFSVGDLSKKQFDRRCAMRFSQRPLYAGTIKYPMSIVKADSEDEDSSARVKSIKQKFPRRLDGVSAHLAWEKFRRTHGLSKNHLRFSNHPNSTINVAGIDGVLKRWKLEYDFQPSIILIDYADILAPENSRTEFRHQVNETWKALRRLSQEWHCCVITPTQSNAGAYDAKLQRMKHFSEDKRKLAHVTGMLGLNQTEEEKAQDIMRLNWILRREESFLNSQCLTVATCFPLGMAMAKCVL